MSKPRVTKLSQEQLDSLKEADFYPNRLSKEDNTKERMLSIQEETEKLFQHPPNRMPTQEEYPRLYNELPTLWAMITEGKFRYWVENDQKMLRHMITLNQKTVENQMSNDDAEKNAGELLANRFLPKFGSNDASRNNRD
jgi:hypothetical protein